MIDGKTKIKVADGSEVGGVKFEQGKVTNVVSINDNLKFESGGIYLNKGDQAKQIKIGADGKSSSVLPLVLMIPMVSMLAVIIMMLLKLA